MRCADGQPGQVEQQGSVSRAVLIRMLGPTERSGVIDENGAAIRFAASLSEKMPGSLKFLDQVGFGFLQAENVGLKFLDAPRLDTPDSTLV